MENNAKNKKQLLEIATRQILVPKLEIADTAWTRMKGLLGRKKLLEDEGMLIRNCASIHMFFMRFSIDAIFLNREMQIIKLVPELMPWRISGCFSASQVLEVPCGMIARTSLKIGMYLCLE